MDIVDIAADLQADLNRSALAHHHALHPEPAPGSLGRAQCLDCAEPIPLERRQAAPQSGRCCDCQKLRDRRLALGS